MPLQISLFFHPQLIPIKYHALLGLYKYKCRHVGLLQQQEIHIKNRNNHNRNNH
jgi:hypothetical protein